jgi:pimeloyl-ACP methyl ester carboxylesterase
MLTAASGPAGAAASSPVCGPMQHVLDANGQSVPPVDAMQPVLLVHGFNGSPSSTWNGDGGIAATLEARGSGFFVGRFDYSYEDNLNQQWVTDPRISGTSTQPGQLADVIDCMAQESRAAHGSGKVIVVVYSLGGLAAQQAISEKVSGREVASDVGGLVSIGTPWLGLDPKFDLATVLTSYYCAAISPSLIINPSATGDACSLLTSSGLNSPAKQAVLTGPGGSMSADMQNLPKIPAGFPVLAVAGDLSWTAQRFNQLEVYQGSDWVVSTSSATSPPMAAVRGSGPLTTALIPCSVTAFPNLPTHVKAGSSVWEHLPLCFHVSLPADPAVTQRVFPVLQQWRASLLPAPAPVDWNNRQYGLTCDNTVQTPVNVVLHSGTATALGPGIGPHDQWDISIQQVTHGVLPSLGEVTAVLFSCSPQPSNFSVQELRIYHTAGGSEIGRIPELPANGGFLPGIYRPGSVAITNGHVAADVMFYGPGDSHASGPSVPGHLSWTWNGQGFIIDTTQGPPQAGSCTVSELSRAVSAANPTVPPGWNVTKYACGGGYAVVQVYLPSAGYGYAVLKQEPSGWHSVYGLDDGTCLFGHCPDSQLPLPAALLHMLLAKAGISG